RDAVRECLAQVGLIDMLDLDLRPICGALRFASHALSSPLHNEWTIVAVAARQRQSIAWAFSGKGRRDVGQRPRPLGDFFFAGFAFAATAASFCAFLLSAGTGTGDAAGDAFIFRNSAARLARAFASSGWMASAFS